MSLSNQIQTLQFQLEIPSATHNRTIQDKVVNVFHYQLQTMLDEVLSSFSKDKPDVAFDRIELALEPIPIDILENELIERTEKALKEYLQKQLERITTQATTPAPSTTEPPVILSNQYGLSPASALIYFLMQGHYPWWDEEQATPLSSRWIGALEKEQKLLIGQLRLVGKQLHPLKRMAYQLSEDALRATVIAVEPGGAPVIFNFHAHLQQQHQQKPISAGISGSDFSKAIWEFTLTYLFVEMGTAFNQKMFIKSHIRQLAQRYNTSYEGVLDFLNRGLRHIAENDVKKQALLTIIKELQEENLIIDDGLQPKQKTYSFIELLRKTTHSPEDKKTMVAYLAALRKSSKERSEIAKQVNQEEFYKLVAYIIPQEKEFIYEYITDTENAYREDPLAGDSRDSFMTSVREFVLTYLLLENTTSFNRKMFLKWQIQQLAQHYNTSFSHVLQFLTHYFKKYHTTKTILFNSLQLLLEEQELTDYEPGALQPTAHKDETMLLSALLALPLLSPQQQAILTAILKKYRDNNNLSVLARLPHAEQLRLLRHLIPQHAALIEYYVESSVGILKTAVPSLSEPTSQIWHLVIEALIVQQPGVFHLETFLEYQLKKWSQRTHNAYDTLLFLYMEHIASSASVSTVAQTLKNAMEVLYLAHHVEAKSLLQGIEKTNITTLISQIVYFLQFGSYPPRAGALSKVVLENVLIALLQHHPKRMAEAIQKQHFMTGSATSWLGIPALSGATRRTWETFLGTIETHIADILVSKDEMITYKTEERYKNILAFYLVTGALPWWAQQFTLKDSAAYIIANPTLFRSFIRQQRWSLAQFRRMDALLNPIERRKFMLAVTDIPVLNIGIALRSAIEEVMERAELTNVYEVWMLFVLQRIEKTLSPREVAMQFMIWFCEEYQLEYDSFILKIITYLKENNYPEVTALFEEERKAIEKRTAEKVPLKMRWITGGEPTEEQQKQLTAWIEEQDTYTVLEVLEDATTIEKPPLSAKTLEIFLTRLHTKNHPLNGFFKELEALTHHSSIRQSFPNLYENALRFYVAYIRLRKTGVLHFGEFLVKWFAHLQKKQADKAATLFTIFSTHLPKKSNWVQRYLTYFSPTNQPVAKKTASEEKTPSHPPEEKKQKPPESLSEKIRIVNSGLVILWPFLTHFFKTLQYIAEDSFCSPAMQQRAVYLLHYLVTGQYEEVGEEHLPLNKVLCGLSVTQLAGGSIIPTEQEKSLTESMLKVVIERWSKIGNTSIDGLRGSYLLREGYLEEQSNGFQLQVEKKGYDILLDYLPWGLGLVKLPWMNKPIYVLWR